MTTATDEYHAARLPQHSTLGDSRDRFIRDGDAFQAGVQHALDRMTAHIDRMLMDPHTSEYLIGCATDILNGVHDGRLT